MPIYEYQCQACQHQLEALQKISDATLVDCPQCGKAELRKRISAVGFRLKGGGWYETDFKSSGKKNLAGESSTSNDSGSSTASAGDSASGTSTSATQGAST